MKPQSSAAGAPRPRRCALPSLSLDCLTSPHLLGLLAYPQPRFFCEDITDPFRESPVLFPSPQCRGSRSSDRPSAPRVSAQGWELKAAAQRRSANTAQGLCLCSWDAAILNKDYPAIGERRKLEFCVDSKVMCDLAVILSSWDSCYPEGYKVL